ncbi:hypothetical protein [Chitinophaga pinensis]|uniref:Uncharacterized protein n=1 Tax=Chitinophaga pinensis (strain ATCC 43595 / DSM 2588 / LMG 13176 / NBRC 15968 / NCIMB 11800 / UQM 2034) TaxID=485918 RepID=A0A979GWG6_CHIPD|nr:hypothetical protein [Chitinophaga pinensis]ACU61984.1 hypothetical protein Cpin_4542 [Chitinophaga pinensis DSM 2588]
MSEQNLSDKFLNSEESGIPIPPVEQGWSAMQHMLDKAMPVHTPSSPTAPKPTPKPGAAVIKGLLKGVLISGTAVTVSVSGWWLYKHSGQTKDTHPAIVQPAADSPAADAVQLSVDSSYSAITPSLSDSNHMKEGLPETDQTQPAATHQAQDAIANSTEEQSQTVTGAGRRAQVAQGTADSKSDQAVATTRVSDGTAKTGNNAAATPGKTNNASQQANAYIKQSTTGNTSRPSRLLTQRNTSNGDHKTSAGLSSNQQPAITDPVIPSGRQQTPRAGSPQLPGAGKPPAASGVNNEAKQPSFAGNYPQQKAAKPETGEANNDASATGTPTSKNPLLPADRNRTSSDLSVPASTSSWILEPVKQPDQSRNVSLLHNSKDRNKIATAAVPSHKREIRAAWNLYGQLPVAIPLEGNTYYFTGPDGKKQYWRLLIPSLRIERVIGSVALSADIMPAINTILPSNEHHSRTAGGRFPQYDTIRSVIKQHGTGLTLQVHYSLTPHLKISAGAQLSLLGKAAVAQTLADTLNKRGATILRAATQTETDSLVHRRISGLAEVYYEFGKWQTGVRTIIPFTNTGLQKNWPIKTPVQVELLFRRRLFTR